MLMIGVMPLPALMNNILGGSCSGRVNTPSTSPSRTTSPGLNLLHQIGRDHAAVYLLGRDADQPVLRRRIGSERIRPPVVAAVDDQAESYVLTRLVTYPFVAGPDQHAGRFRALRLYPFDFPRSSLVVHNGLIISR